MFLAILTASENITYQNNYLCPTCFILLLCISLWRHSDLTEKKTESYVFSGLYNSISRGRERKSATGRFAIGDLAVYLKYSFFQLGRIRWVRTLQIAN